MDFNFPRRDIYLPDLGQQLDDVMQEANKSAAQQHQAALDTAAAIKEINTKIDDIQADSAKQLKSSKRWNVAVFIVSLLTLVATVVIGLVQLLR